MIEGPSLGLALFLLLAARASGVPVEQDIVAIAGVEDSGAVVPVDKDGLRLKLKALDRLAPGIRRIVVSADQEAEARRHAPKRFKILGFRSASETVSTLSGEVVVGKLIQAGGTVAERDALTTSLLRLVLLGRNQCLDWSPVERAADKALQTWTGLSGDQRYTLEFVRAVAARHEANRGVLSIPPPSWLGSLPRQLRLKALANLVQQASDTGSPPAAEVLALVEPELPPDPTSAFSPQLELAGAVARLRSSSGRIADALADQESLARAHFEALNFEEVSRPLSEWLRLAGVLGDNENFDRGLAFADEAETAGAFGPESKAYVTLARARGQVMLNRTAVTDLGETLRDLSRNRAIPVHVQRSAMRWRLEWLRRVGRPEEELARAREELDALCPKPDGAGDVFLILTGLDGALDAGNGPAAEKAVAALRDAEPALVSRLLEAIAPSDAGRFLSRHYPY